MLEENESSSGPRLREEVTSTPGRREEIEETEEGGGGIVERDKRWMVTPIRPKGGGIRRLEEWEQERRAR